jgi:hypothetical protein
MVDVQLVRRLADEAMVTLQCLKEYKEDKGRPLAHMTLLQKSRYHTQGDTGSRCVECVHVSKCLMCLMCECVVNV